MRKLNLLISAFAVAALASCSNDEVVSSINDTSVQARQSIGFSPAATNVTRSSVYTPTAMFPNFRVIGLWSSSATIPSTAWIEGKEFTTSGGDNVFSPAPSAGGLYQGFSATHTASGKVGIEIVRNNGGWDYADQSQIQYWPYSEKTDDEGNVTSYEVISLDFRAVAPASSDVDLQNPSSYAYTTPSTTAQMVDVCYTDATGAKSSPVNLKFKHLLSQIVFKAVKATNYVVDIQAIEIGGVNTKGTYNLTALVNGASGTQISSTTTPAAFPGMSGAAFSVPADTSQLHQITATGQELLLIPQKADPWNKKSLKADDGSIKQDQGAYLKLTYRAKTSGAEKYSTGDGDGWTSAYFPLKLSWKAGCKYSYVLLFGGVKNPDTETPSGGDDNPDPGKEPNNPGGYDETGKPKAPSVAITFTASVEDWEPYNINVTD